MDMELLIGVGLLGLFSFCVFLMGWHFSKELMKVGKNQIEGWYEVKPKKRKRGCRR